MSHLPPLKPKKVIQMLRKAGYFQDHIRGSHYYFKHPDRGGIVVVPYHTKELKRGTLQGIFAQTGMTVDEFLSYM